MKKTITPICLTGAILSLGVAKAEDSAVDAEPTNYCVSADSTLGETAYWGRLFFWRAQRDDFGSLALTLRATSLAHVRLLARFDFSDFLPTFWRRGRIYR